MADIELQPGGTFAGTVTVRRRIFASEDSGFAVLDCERRRTSEIVLVGPLAHLERARAGGGRRRMGGRPALRPAGQGARGAPARALRRRRAARLPAHVSATSAPAARRARTTATATERARRDRRRPAAAPSQRAGLSPRARRRGGALLGRAARHARPAPAARAARARAPRRRASTSTTATAPTASSREQPYELTSVFGVGFSTADAIARGVGVAADEPRARARRASCTRSPRPSATAHLPARDGAARAGRRAARRRAGAGLLARWREAGDVELERGRRAPGSTAPRRRRSSASWPSGCARCSTGDAVATASASPTRRPTACSATDIELAPTRSGPACAARSRTGSRS